MGEIRKLKSSRGGDPPRESTPRRLAAIVAGDIAGYSRLMQIDEEGTHLRVKRIERDLIEPSIVGHHGRLVKTTGDGFIAIFDSPVEAVRCGIVIQQNMVGRNASMPKHHWIEYRIGVNLGDVIIEADDVFGDGVNIATRLEGIADPGQVYISGGIYEQIKHKLVCGYESLGDRKVKNITDPVRVYRVLPDPAAFNRTRKRRENILIALLSLFLLVIASGVRYTRLDIENLAAFEGSCVHYWASPIEGRLCAGQEVALVGGGNSAGQAAVYLASQVARVWLLVRGPSLEATMSSYLIERIESQPNITVLTQTVVTALEGQHGTLAAIRWRHGPSGAETTRPVRHLFLFIGATPNAQWLARYDIALDDKGFVRTEPGIGHGGRPLETSRPGVFAIGDIRSGSVKRVAAAVGEGAQVVATLHAFLADAGGHPAIVANPRRA